MQTINVQQLAELLKQGNVDLLDVRTPVEFREVHASGATNVPLDRLDPAAIAGARNGRSGEPLYVICRSGNRSSKAVQQLINSGVENVIDVEGGTSAWIAAGLPVVRGQKAISLERQVRIAAGFLALLGALLGLFVHPAFIWLSAFIGAGLIFAGITDTCGMGMVLARMPWNQCGADSGNCSVK